MKNINLFYSAVLYVLINSLFCASANAQVPYFETFQTTTTTNLVLGGNPGAILTAGKTIPYPGGTITDSVNKGFLRLTAANGNERGFAYNVNSFPATYGLKLSFEYFTYGGTGADGICFFLFDATTPTFSIGGFGGSLGYAPRSGETGLSGAYLGIGLDEYGNFCNNTEGRNTPSNISTLIPNTVTLRGKGDGTANYWYNNITNGEANYNYITHVQTTALSPSFALSGGAGRHTSTTDSGYRKVEIDLIPRTITVGANTGTAYTINVRIITGSANGPVVHNVITGVNYDQIAPANLKFGYGASTGGSNNYHEIRNIDIKNYNPVPQNPVAVNRSQSVCSGNSSQFMLRDAITPKNAPLALDSNSLRFINPTNSNDTVTSYTFPNIGTITVDPNGKGSATFVASSTFTSGTATIRFVMNDNYSKVSNAATLTLEAGTGITGNTIAMASGAAVITGSTPVYGGTYTYLWQESTTSATTGFYTAPSIANAKDYNVRPSAASKRWFRRVVIAGNCLSYSNAMAITGNPVALPVTLMAFSAKAQESSVLIQWETAEEQAISFYSIERSADGRTFIEIGTQNAQNAGNATHRYALTDNAPLNGRSYYRLAIHDLREGTSYSAVIPVSFGSSTAEASLLLYPEPASNILQVSSSANGTATLLNIQGSVMARTSITTGVNQVDVSALPAGIYYFTVEVANTRIVRKFSKR